MFLKNKRMNRIKVTCAIIEKESDVLVVQRSEKMSLPLKWEFPGGKIENGESEEGCIVREIKEELNLDIDVSKNCIHLYLITQIFQLN
jgi:8-oxo-dGTP diphosphatase